MSSRRNPFSLAVVLMPLRAASAQQPQPPTFLNFEGDYKSETLSIVPPSWCSRLNTLFNSRTRCRFNFYLDFLKFKAC